jgi:hypothetical protein
MISSSAKQGRSSPRCQSAVILRLLGGQKVQILGQQPPPDIYDKKSFFTLPFPLCTTHSLPSLHPPSLTHSPRKTQLRREETEWANKSKQNYLKTHTTDFLSYFPPFFFRTIGKKLFPFGFFLSTLIPPSFVRSRSQLVSSLHPRETKLCYLHLPLWLFGNKNQSVCLSSFAP